MKGKTKLFAFLSTLGIAIMAMSGIVNANNLVVDNIPSLPASGVNANDKSYYPLEAESGYSVTEEWLKAAPNDQLGATYFYSVWSGSSWSAPELYIGPGDNITYNAIGSITIRRTDAADNSSINITAGNITLEGGNYNGITVNGGTLTANNVNSNAILVTTGSATLSNGNYAKVIVNSGTLNANNIGCNNSTDQFVIKSGTATVTNSPLHTVIVTGGEMTTDAAVANTHIFGGTYTNTSSSTPAFAVAGNGAKGIFSTLSGSYTLSGDLSVRNTTYTCPVCDEVHGACLNVIGNNTTDYNLTIGDNNTIYNCTHVIGNVGNIIVNDTNTKVYVGNQSSYEGIGVVATTATNFTVNKRYCKCIRKCNYRKYCRWYYSQ